MMVDYNSLEAYMIERMEKCFKVIKIKKNNLHIRTKNEYQNTVSSLTAIYKQGKIQRKIVKMYIDVLSKANKEEVSLQRSTELAERIKQLSIDDKLSLDSFWKLKKSCVCKNSVLASVENEQGIEVFGTDAIVYKHRNEFIERLQPASIDEELSLFEKETLSSI